MVYEAPIHYSIHKQTWWCTIVTSTRKSPSTKSKYPGQYHHVSVGKTQKKAKDFPDHFPCPQPLTASLGVRFMNTWCCGDTSDSLQTWKNFMLHHIIYTIYCHICWGIIHHMRNVFSGNLHSEKRNNNKLTMVIPNTYISRHIYWQRRCENTMGYPPFSHVEMPSICCIPCSWLERRTKPTSEKTSNLGHYTCLWSTCWSWTKTTHLWR